MRCACGHVFELSRNSSGAAMMLASSGYAYGPSRAGESGPVEYLYHLRKILDGRMLVLWGVGGSVSDLWGDKRNKNYVRVGLRPLVRLSFGKLAVAAGTRVP